MSQDQAIGPWIPGVEFYQFNSDSPPPEPASLTARGSLPAKALQVCSPVLEASGFGWYMRRANGSLLPAGMRGYWRRIRKRLAAPERFKADFPLLDGIGGRIPFIDAHALLAIH